ncbi:MAG TPA: hypothetical protein VMV29_15640 [Ktedonobacterales bacterium]|nr:hypothetical protein [Ktedonobacterales bacterium]
MNDEPYSPNHAHDARTGADADPFTTGDTPLSPDLAALDRRLTTDGARWQNRLPPAEQVAARIRAIPWSAPTETSATPSAAGPLRGNVYMTPFEDQPTDAYPTARVGGQRATGNERRSTGKGRILALVAAVLIVALLGAVFTQLARLGRQNGGRPSATASVRRATATPSGTATPGHTPTPHNSSVTGTWQIVASPDTSGTLNGIAAVSAVDLWAVGTVPGTTGPSTTLIEHSDGVSWQVVSSPNPNPSQTGDALNAVAAVSANDVWAVGTDGTNTLVEHWDGAVWSVIPSPSPSSTGNYLYGVTAIAGDNVWAAGYDITGQGCGQIPEPLIEHWNGAQWSVAPTPTIAAQYGAKLYAIAAGATNDVWAVGQVVEHFDGSAWSLVNGPLQVGLFGVTALSPSDVWVVGVGSADTPAIAHWDGSQLTTTTSPTTAPLGQTTLLGISGVNANDIWAVGGNPQVGCAGVSLPLIEHWNGQAWSLVPSVDLGAGNYGYLDAVVAVSANNVWAVGQQYGQSITQHSLIEHYTG